jgi:hypothetical protein
MRLRTEVPEIKDFSARKPSIGCWLLRAYPDSGKPSPQGVAEAVGRPNGAVACGDIHRR